MRQGTTPTHNFELPFEIPEGASVRIVYAQNNVIILEKTTGECEIEGCKISTKLSVEETLRFDYKKHIIKGVSTTHPVEIQIGVKTVHGDQTWSDIIEELPERCLKKDGVI
jgi:hypothetical protein